MHRKPIDIKIAKVIVVVAILSLIAYPFVKMVPIILNKTKPRPVATMEDYYDKDLHMEYLKSQASDINGMTQYDKYEMGLTVGDGSDTDMDGLSDKDEIEVYGSDPLKYSTAGDLYSDAYKAEHGMSFTEPAEYTGDFVFANNECAEVALEADTAQDFEANIVDYTGNDMYKLEGKNVLRQYFVAVYDGHVTIDLGACGLDPENIAVYTQSFYSDKASGTGFKTEGKKITVNKTYPMNTPYMIYITEADSNALAKILPTVGSVDTTVGRRDTIDFNIGAVSEYTAIPRILVYGSFIFSKEMTILYDDTVVGTNVALQEIVNYIVSMRYQNNLRGEDPNKTLADYKNIKVIPASEYEWRVNLFKSGLGGFFQKFNFSGSNSKNEHEQFFCWFTYEDYLRNVQEYGTRMDYVSTVIPEVSGVKIADGFSYADTLPFRNFNTARMNGVCGGISHLTAQLFNTGSMNYPSGAFTSAGISESTGNEMYYLGKVDGGGEVYSYDLNANEYNSTLLDKGLIDYRNPEYTDEHLDENGRLTKNLDETDKNFVTMLEYGCLMSNQICPSGDYYINDTNHVSSSDGKILYDKFESGDLVDKIAHEIDEGRIVDAAFMVKMMSGKREESGHAINIVGYQNAHTLNTDNRTAKVFYVYDSNAPMTLGTLTTQTVHMQNGRSLLIYHLNVPGMAYAADSAGQNASMFLAMDHDFNVFNER